jgi:hypothetical protein
MKEHKMSIERNVTATLQNRFKESEMEKIIFCRSFQVHTYFLMGKNQKKKISQGFILKPAMNYIQSRKKI